MSDPVPPPSAGTGITQTRVGWMEFVRREWGLAVLALALSLMVFQLVSQDIRKDATLPGWQVAASTEGHPDLIVLFPDGKDRVNLDLHVSDLNRSVAERALKEHGKGAVKLTISSGPRQVPHRRVDASDRLEVPFPDSWFREGARARALEALDGYVYRVVERTVSFQLPATVPEGEALFQSHGLACTVEFIDPAIHALRLHAGITDLVLRPDPIDLAPFLAKPITDGMEIEVPAPLQFSAWRGAASGEADRLFRSRLVLPSLRCKLRFRVADGSWRAKPVENTLVLLVKDPEAYSFDIRLPEDYGISDVARRMAGRLEAPPDIHAELRLRAEYNLGTANDLRGWCWGIEFEDDLPPPNSSEPKTIRGHIRFVPLTPKLRMAPVRFVPVGAQANPVEITVTPR